VVVADNDAHAIAPTPYGVRLGAASSKRSPALPDVPTFKENGIDFEGDSWLAISRHAGAPGEDRPAGGGVVAQRAHAGAAARRAQVGRGREGIRRRRRLEEVCDRPQVAATRTQSRQETTSSPMCATSHLASGVGATVPASCQVNGG
jgi:hypothetical protein